MKQHVLNYLLATVTQVCIDIIYGLYIQAYYTYTVLNYYND